MPTRNGKHTRTRSRRQSEKKTENTRKRSETKTNRQKKFISTSYIYIVGSIEITITRCLFFVAAAVGVAAESARIRLSPILLSPTLQHSFKHSTPNYLLKLPLYRHWLLAFFAWNTNVENHLEIECDVWKLCESMRLWLFLCYITVYLFFARLFSIIWSVLPRENNGNVPFQLKVEVEGHFFLSSIHLSVCHLVAYPWVRFSQ